MGINMFRRLTILIVAATLGFISTPSQAGLTRSRIFLPSQEIPVDTKWTVSPPETRTVETADGLSLKILFWKGASDRLIVFFHGNAGNQYKAALALQGLVRSGDSILFASYRGYGGNPGSPSEAGLYQDGRAALAEGIKLGFTPNRVFLVGYSLGTGVALKLGSETKLGGVVTFEAFTRLPDMAPKLIRFLIADKFDNLEHIKANLAPVILVHATDDKLVPYAMGRKLYDAAGIARGLITIQNGGHQLPTSRIVSTILQSIDFIENNDYSVLREPAFPNRDRP